MRPKQTVAALFLVQVIAGAGLAQDPFEFSRGSGGEIALHGKQTRSLSGSLGMLMGTSRDVKGYEATLGGALLEDRLWFFAAASHSEGRWFSSALPELPERAVSGVVDTKLSAQLGDRQSLAASFSAGRELLTPAPTTAADRIPSSFLSLRYTGVVSSNMFFSATFSQRSVTQP
jgi:hypothetical protein